MAPGCETHLAGPSTAMDVDDEMQPLTKAAAVPTALMPKYVRSRSDDTGESSLIPSAGGAHLHSHVGNKRTAVTEETKQRTKRAVAFADGSDEDLDHGEYDTGSLTSLPSAELGLKGLNPIWSHHPLSLNNVVAVDSRTVVTSLRYCARFLTSIARPSARRSKRGRRGTSQTQTRTHPLLTHEGLPASPL